MAIIYMAEHKASGRKYVGFSKKKTFGPRKKAHIKASKRRQPKTVFHRALREFGPEAFEWSILDTHGDKEYCLRTLEPHWISRKQAMVPKGFNMTIGGSGTWKGTRKRKSRFKSPMAIVRAIRNMGKRKP